MPNLMFARGLSDNGYAFSVPPRRDMSHNRQTLQDNMEAWPDRLAWGRQLTRQNGGLA